MGRVTGAGVRVRAGWGGWMKDAMRRGCFSCCPLPSAVADDVVENKSTQMAALKTIQESSAVAMASASLPRLPLGHGRACAKFITKAWH